MRRKTPLTKVGTQAESCSIDLRLRILGNLPFFNGIPKAELASINAKFSDRSYSPSEAIYREGNLAERLFVVADGKVKRLKFGANNKEVLLSILKPGDFFGNFTYLSGDAYPETAIALTQVCALSISNEDFRTIVDRTPELAIRSMQIMAARLNAATEQVLQLGSMSMEQRLAFTLLDLDKKLGVERTGRRVIDVPLSQEELAGMTATTPESVSRWMSQMRKLGVLQSGRKWVGLLQPEYLQDLLNNPS
jgi:CRP-like cAMP-binding protein